MPQTDSLLQVKGASKAFGSRALFADAGFSVNEGEHLGVIGPNGAGKTTLFKILLGEDAFDAGEVVRSKRLRLGYLSQHDQWQPDETGNTYLERVATLPVWETKSRGRVLQLTEEALSRPVLSLSGGYRMRIKLMGLIGQDPNLMLLDEPTNYLDLETTLLLERFLQGYEGAFLLISHDREFLKRTTDHTLEIEQREVTKYNGDIDDYFEQKELLRSQLEARAQGLAEKRAAILDFVNRFGAKATKARQAQSRLKTLAKMEAIDVKPLPVSAVIRIPAPHPTGKMTLALERAAFGYGDRTVIQDVSFQVMRGDHVAVVGLNGAGKSTLLKGVAGILAPKSGTLRYGHEVGVALFAQHVVEDLVAEDTVLQSLERTAHRDVLPQDIKDLAGSLLFSGDDIRKPVRVLSGGEKSRLALGRILLRKAPCLVLDEPTNHLDFQTVEALTQALQKFQGTVIAVSHDRGFVRRMATKILEVDSGRVRLYPGTYDDYVWHLEKSMQEASDEPSSAPARKTVAAEKAEKITNRYEAKKEAERKLRACERRLKENEQEMAASHAEIAATNAKLAQQGVPEAEVAALVDAISGHGRRLNELEDEWMRLSDAKEALTRELDSLR